MLINGEPRGNYRVCARSSPRADDLVGNPQRHAGFGLSFDQRLGRDWNLFGRLGRRTTGEGIFDEAVTIGFEHGGRAGGRSKDSVGLALGLLRTSPAWRDANATTTANGFAAVGTERVAELYYRMHANESLEISPDLQLIRRPGGDGTAPTIRVLGIRAATRF